MRIYKYHLPDPRKLNKIEMPLGAIPFSVGIQEGEIMLWAMVDIEQKLSERYFFICATGQDVQRGSRFIGTVQVGHPVMEFVWHIFEIDGVVGALQ